MKDEAGFENSWKPTNLPIYQQTRKIFIKKGAKDKNNRKNQTKTKKLSKQVS